MLACFEASRQPSPTPSFDPCSIEFLPQVSAPTELTHRLYVSPPPQISVPRFPILFPSFSPLLSPPLLQPPIYSNGIFARLTHSLHSGHVVIDDGDEEHDDGRRRRREAGGTALSPPLTRSFLRSLSFNGKGCSILRPASLARSLALCHSLACM